MTNLESIARKYLGQVYPDERVLYNYRPDWLKNTTGFNLELDIFYPDLNLAIEANGIYHKISKAQKIRDHRKKEFCQARGVKLVCFSWPGELFKLFPSKKLSPQLIHDIVNYRPIKSNKKIGWLVHQYRIDSRMKRHSNKQAKETLGNKLRRESRKKLWPSI